MVPIEIEDAYSSRRPVGPDQNLRSAVSSHPGQVKSDQNSDLSCPVFPVQVSSMLHWSLILALQLAKITPCT